MLTNVQGKTEGMKATLDSWEMTNIYKGEHFMHNSHHFHCYIKTGNIVLVLCNLQHS